jgi:hypothetical protein
MLLFPGGYETDTELRAFLTEWLDVMRARGSRAGIEAEMDRVTRNTDTTVLGTINSMKVLGESVSYTHATATLSAAGWVDGLEPGDALTIRDSIRGSNGRCTVYGISGNNVQVGHRAARSTAFSSRLRPDALEIHVREDRAANLLGLRIVNTTASSAAVEVSLDVTAGTVLGGAVISGSANVLTTGSSASITFQPTASTGEAVIAEVTLRLANATDYTTFELGIVSGSPTGVFLGDLGLAPQVLSGASPSLGALWPWRWGGVVHTGLRSGMNETGLTVLRRAHPGWFVGVGSPESAEEDPYTMASPEEYVVVEVDHRNPANYTEQELAALVRDVLLPADVDGLLGLL